MDKQFGMEWFVIDVMKHKYGTVAEKIFEHLFSATVKS